MRTASTREEGKAARQMGMDQNSNPYRREANRLGGGADSRLLELANEWDAGYASGKLRLMESN